MFFCQENRPKLKEQNPSATVGELAKQLGAAWQAVSEEQKAPFQKAAEKDRERYARAKDEYQAKQSSGMIDDEDDEEDEEDGSEDED